MKKANKYLSVFLSITLLINTFPSNAFAAEINKQATQTTQAKESQKKEPAKIVGEVTEKREKNVKNFKMDDGSFEAVIYGSPVHFLDNGVWKDIDNTLVDEGSDVTNKANDFKVKFGKKANDSKLVTIQKDKYEIAWGILKDKKVDNQVVEDTVNKTNAIDSEVENGKLPAGISDEEKKKAVPNTSSTVNFKNIYSNVDLQYKLQSDNVKENIIINKKEDSPVFEFALQLKNVVPKLNDDKTITFFDEKDTSKAVYKINAPYMYDAKNQISDKIDVKLLKNNNQYVIQVIPDSNWLNDENTCYPVVLDPTVSTSVTGSNITTCVLDATSNQKLGTSSGIAAGIQPIGYKMLGPNLQYKVEGLVTYMKFPLPALTSSQQVISAQFSANAPSQSASANVRIHQVNQSWDPSNITSGNNSSYNSNIEDSTCVLNGTAATYSWDITNIAKKWYSSNNNTGLMLDTDADNGYLTFTPPPANVVTLNNSLIVTIQYIDNNGLENYWTYHSQSVNRAGTGYINDYNGNLVFTHNDLSSTGNRLPANIMHVFNSGSRSNDIGYGNGWRLNLNQKVSGPLTFSDGTYYSHIDEDGTTHYYKYDSASNTYKNSEGLDTTLQVNADSTITIIDNQNNKLNFNTLGYLSTIKDNNGNVETLNYSGTILKSVTDGAGRISTLDTDTSGRLTGVIDSSNRRTSYAYTGNLLTSITYPDGKQTVYSYDSNNNMTSATNYDGYKVTYSYNTVAPYRISSVAESNSDGTTGSSLNITYGYNMTSFTDAIGRKNIYQFNNSGNTVSIKDGDNGAEYYKYGSTSNTNKLLSNSKAEKTVINYLKNGNVESSTDWTPYVTDNSSYGSNSICTTKPYLGNQSILITQNTTSTDRGYTQDVTLKPGNKYTFSSYVSTDSIGTGGGAVLYYTYKNASGVATRVNSQFITGTTDWNRYELSFTLPSDASSNTVTLGVALTGALGTAYFDCLQLEDGSLANKYNLVENPDFSYTSTLSDYSILPTYWNKNSDCDYSDTTVTLNSTSDPQHPTSLSGNSFNINGIVNKNKNLYQNIKVSGKAGDTFVAGGWAKGTSIPLTTGRSFAIEVGINGKDGSYTTQDIPFNTDSSDWQYISGSVVVDRDYSSIDIKLLYGNNANSVYFDGIQLYKDGFGTNYGYDGNGNLISNTNAMNQSTQNQYTNNNLTSTTDAAGNTDTATYDNNHNLLSSTSGENVVSSFTYDSFGNQLTSKVGNSTLFTQTSQTYSNSGNFLKSQTDELGNTIAYNYDETKGLLNSVTDGKNQTTSYGYDSMDRLTSVSKSVDGGTVTNSYGYSNDRLSTITHNGFNYNFGYDSLGNNTSISVGNQNLITNSYDSKTGRLTSSTYGNGQTVGQSYDNSDRVTKKQVNGSDIAAYEYDASGNLGYKNDIVNNVSYRYIYDLSNRLTKAIDSLGNITSYILDPNGNGNSIAELINGKSFSTSYSYNKDSKLKNMTYTRDSSNSISLNYDAIGRLSNTVVNTGTANFTTSLSYAAGVNGSSSNTISSINNNGNAINYSYDQNGNIATITQNGQTISYYYNELNELKREDNQVLNKTITYSYDAGGNINGKTEYAYTTGTPNTATKTNSYVYGDTNWKDKLTSFNGNAITYDAIGNPLTYNGWTYTWQAGRQLQSMNGNGYNISYKYNDVGIRTQKTVNGVTTNYHLVDDRVTFESNGTDNIYYTYDNANNLVSMNLNGVEYYYVKNAQGDIIGLFDKTGTQVVSYSYDSWGQLISTTGTLASTVGAKNPYRYRGYRYDVETGMYYLQSRYYNPEWGRFINADDPQVMKGLVEGALKDPAIAKDELLLMSNMFSYCGNNPVMNSDPSGYFYFSTTHAVAFFLACTTIISIITGAKKLLNWWMQWSVKFIIDTFRAGVASAQFELVITTIAGLVVMLAYFNKVTRDAVEYQVKCAYQEFYLTFHKN